MQALIGIGVFIFLAWLFSENRRHFPWRFAVAGVGVHFVLAALLLNTESIRQAFQAIDSAAAALREATAEGTSLVFGYVGGGATPFEVVNTDALTTFAFHILPQLIVLSAIFALLWYWGILQLLIRGLAYGLQKTFKIGGALGLGAASSVFLGMVESPMTIKPYLKTMKYQELFALMTCGMSTIAGSVMLLYATLLARTIEHPFSHLFIASVIAVPAALTIARIMMPVEANFEPASLAEGTQYQSAMDALAKGTQDGLTAYLNVLATLVVFVTLVAIVNLALGALPDAQGAPLTIERLLGWLFTPIAWCMGLPPHEAAIGGELLGVKIILTELVAFTRFAALPEGVLSAKSAVIMTYGLTSFANIASLGIIIGGLSAIVPERRTDILRHAPKAVLAGSLASCLSATIVGLVT